MHIREPLPEELPSLKRLYAATAVAALIAAALTLTVILPAERGIDPSGIGQRLHLTRMGQIKAAMAEPDAPLQGRPERQDQLTISLPAGQGQEVKMDMAKGYAVQYRWQSDGAPVYHDTHGDTYADENAFVSYSKAEAVTEDAGTLRAIYGGHHGWYWRNNSDKAVQISLWTEGEYRDIRAK